ncbi:MAG: outer membrane protein assembly factor BamC [Gammaproteobacteria bacterium]|nr:outer membrane protein assembly factor BamC [Gammaproteobacteria bacterium]
MKHRILNTCILLLTTLLITACGKNDRPEYQGAEYYKSLELPPDLALDKSTPDIEVPRPTVAALEDFQAKHRLNKAVSPEFKGIRLKHEGNMYFLEVDAEPEVVWPKIEAFWDNEGVRVLENRPMLGFMKTDWTKQMQIREDDGYLRKLFSKLEPDFRDKFTMRIEPAADRTKTHVFVAHYGIEVLVEESGDDQGSIQWRGRKSDVELEREILSRLTLFAGLSENQAESLLKEYKPFQSYVTYRETFKGDDIDPEAQSALGDTKVAVLSMKGSMDFVWYRTIRALDRLQMEEITLDKKKGRISFTLPTDAQLSAADEEEVDEIAESSWLMNWMKGKTGSKEGKKPKKFELLLTEMPGYVDFTLLDSRGIEDNSAIAAQLRAALARALE